MAKIIWIGFTLSRFFYSGARWFKYISGQRNKKPHSRLFVFLHNRHCSYRLIHWSHKANSVFGRCKECALVCMVCRCIRCIQFNGNHTCVSKLRTWFNIRSNRCRTNDYFCCAGTLWYSGCAAPSY